MGNSARDHGRGTPRRNSTSLLFMMLATVITLSGSNFAVQGFVNFMHSHLVAKHHESEIRLAKPLTLINGEVLPGAILYHTILLCFQI